jgi:hypothetical protein
MVESQGLGGDAGQLRLVYLARCIYYHNCSHDLRPDGGAEENGVSNHGLNRKRIWVNNGS